MIVLIFIGITLLIISYVVYPIFLFLVPQKTFTFNKEFVPRVSLIISAYNEERLIYKKIRNCLELDYPKDLIEIIVTNDGSTDKTAKIVSEFNDVILVNNLREGKTFAQNEAVKISSGDILIFSDANTMYDKQAIKHLIKWFSDKSIGVVCGRISYSEDTTERTYWQIENYIKILESRNGKLIGANGGIYAIRRSNYIELDKNSISDLVEPLLILLHGQKVIFEPEALGYEESPKSVFKRKRRIITRSIFSLKYILPEIKAVANFDIFVRLLFHKIIRWLTPLIILIIILATIMDRLTNIFYLEIGLFCLILLTKQGRYFVLTLAASLVSFYDIIMKKNKTVWEKEV